MAIDKHRVLDRVRAANKSLTPQRMCVLDAIANTGCPVSAYTLQETLTAQGNSLNISTIYRVLDFWVGLGLILCAVLYTSIWSRQHGRKFGQLRKLENKLDV